MNAALQKSLDAIESSLASLLESVTADDPSADAAVALVAADDELSLSLEQLVTHQTNHQKLLHLRALSSALDSELSALLTNLSQARSELLSAPSTVLPSHSKHVEYDTLLSYATKISKFTRPPTHFTQQTNAATSTSTAVVKSEANGNTTSSTAENAATAAAAGESTSGNAATRPTAEDIAMLDPTANMPFAPWPSEDVMKRGILANMGYMEAVPGAAGPAGDAQAAGLGENQAGQASGAAGGRQMTEADRERAREEAARIEAERKAKEQEVFQGLDLYDPDSD